MGISPFLNMNIIFDAAHKAAAPHPVIPALRFATARSGGRADRRIR